MKSKICPSMMCADIIDIKSTLEIFEKTGIEYLHIDVMDGAFAPNYMLGIEFCKALKKHCSIPLDIHLMIEQPDNKLEWFPISANDIVSVHAESTYHLHRVITKIKSLGAKAFVALNPATPLSNIEYVLGDIDGVMLMTVNPGYAGQKLIPAMIDKIKQTRALLDQKGFTNVQIEVDGNVSFENLSLMRSAGANMFVSGSSGVFTKDMSLEDAIKKTREII